MPARALPSARRYAQALFQWARERGEVDRWLRDLGQLTEVATSPDLASFLEAPSLRPEERLDALRRVLPEVGESALRFALFLARRRAFSLLPRIRDAFQGLVDASQGVQQVEVLSAIPLGPGEEERVREHLEEFLGKRVRLVLRVDPSLLGGLIIKVGDRVIDGSVRGRLQALRETLVGGGVR